MACLVGREDHELVGIEDAMEVVNELSRAYWKMTKHEGLHYTEAIDRKMGDEVAAAFRAAKTNKETV